MTDVNYDIDIIYKEVQKILDKNGITIPVKLFLNYFKQMSINEKFDIIDNKELEKLYKTVDEVNYMFLTAIKKEKTQIRNEGKVEEKINNIIKLSVKKLGVISKELEEKIKNCRDIDKLDKIIDNIFDITSFNDISKILE